jgi:hypothetical protein
LKKPSPPQLYILLYVSIAFFSIGNCLVFALIFSFFVSPPGQKLLESKSITAKLGMEVHACKPTPWKAEAGELQVLGQTWLHSEFKASLSYTGDTHTHTHTHTHSNWDIL